MKLAASNLILPAFQHADLLPVLPGLGIEGLEVAPAHTWLDPWDGVPSAEVRAYRKAAKAAGLKITGLHCLLSGRPDLGLFDLPGMGGRTINYLVQLSAICRDLGGKTLILGPRWRRRLTERVAWVQGRAFLELLLPRIETHGTVLCFNQLGPGEGDFCTTARECYMLVNAIDHPAFGLHLSAAGLAANGENGHAPFAAVRGRLEHFHADEPDFATPGSTGQIDHADVRRHLAAISYSGWVSLVQRNRPGKNLFAALTEASSFAANRYLAANLH
jgi:sugar phosphate isomerase/epimerase